MKGESASLGTFKYHLSAVRFILRTVNSVLFVMASSSCNIESHKFRHSHKLNKVPRDIAQR